MLQESTRRRAWESPLLTGRRAQIFAVVAIAAPSLIWLLLSQLVSTGVFLTYVPFVLLSAVVLRSLDAALVALACALVADFFFMEPQWELSTSPNDLFSMGMLLVISAFSIFLMRIIRHRVSASLDEPSGSVIFSEKGGEAWVNWHGSKSPVKLGPHKDVAEMMEDYIAQVELGERLNGRKNAEKPMGVRPTASDLPIR
jgi:Domain of unknown function (DUF4118)